MSSGTSFARACRTSASCSWLRLVPSREMTASPPSSWLRRERRRRDRRPGRVDLVLVVDPADRERDARRDRGGDLDLGDPVGRLLLAQRAVGHLLERRRLDDEVGQDARVDPLDDGRDAPPGRAHRRARLLTELLLGRRVGGLLAAPARRPCWACSAAAAAASCARLMKLMRASLASRPRSLTTRIQAVPPRPDAPRRRPLRPPRDRRRREPRGHRAGLAIAPPPAPSRRRRARRPRALEADQRRPRLAERPRPAGALRPRARRPPVRPRRPAGATLDADADRDRPRRRPARGRPIRPRRSPASWTGSPRSTPDEIDRLACAEPAPIAFGATIARFLPPEQAAALEAMEAAVEARLDPAAAARPGVRDAVEGYATELVLGPFLDELLSEPFRERTARAADAGLGCRRRPAALRPERRRGPGPDRAPRRAGRIGRQGARGDRQARRRRRAAGRRSVAAGHLARGRRGAAGLVDPGRAAMPRPRSHGLTGRCHGGAWPGPVAAARLAHLLVLRHAFAPVDVRVAHPAVAPAFPARRPAGRARPPPATAR